MWVQWSALGVVAALMGAMTYHLIGTEHSQDLMGVLAMGALTGWFILEDIHVDRIYERDQRLAEHEAKQWR